jgi:glycerophosphoryl diester phosphodiesterase
MEIIGHRGCADQYPENTVTAVARSSRHLDAVEVDVRRCGSGELVVFHDERVDELTDGTGRVADRDWRELRDLDVERSGESIPRLETVLAVVPPDVRVQLELKERGLAADVRAAVAGADADLDVVVSSFEPAALAEVNELGWDVPTGYLFESDPAANLRTAAALDCDAVHPHYDCCLETDVVADAQERGFEVVAWKAARTPEEVEALRAVGVDAVTADRWDLV